MDRIKIYLPTILVVLSIIALIPMASGISDLSLKSGTLLEKSTLDELRALFTASGYVWNLFIILIVILTIILFVSYLFQPKKKLSQTGRKNSAISTIIQILSWGVALILLRRHLKLEELNFDFLDNAAQSFSDIDFTASEIPAKSMPNWTAFTLSFLLIAVLLLIIWRSRRSSGHLQELDELISLQAEESIEELERGIEFHEVITQCYFEMMRLLLDTRGIKRKQHMTPREFENRLIGLGFPKDPISELTRLFEMVRYGGVDPDETQKIRALDCLRAISARGEIRG